jgi:hypothetical protein
MRLTEDSLRAALKATGDEFPAHRLPDLVLPSDRASARLQGRTANGRRWLAAAAAVIAVLAIIATSLLLASGARPVRPANPLVQLPAYYVALQQDPVCICSSGGPDSWITNPDRALVRSRSGRTLAVVTPPAPYGTFAAVRAAADDRTFVLAAQVASTVETGYPATKFYLLHISPAASAGHRAVITPVRVPVVPAGTIPFGIALSPDGPKLALLEGASRGQRTTPELLVWDLRSGAVRSWSVQALSTGGLQISSTSLEWAADNRTLAVEMRPRWLALGLLNTTAAGAAFKADARIVQLPHVTGADAMLTPDGRHVLQSADNSTVIDRHPSETTGAGYSVRRLNLGTGAFPAVARNADLSSVSWINTNGSELLVAAPKSQPQPTTMDSAGLSARAVLVYPHGTVTVGLPARTLAMAW